VRGRRVAKWLSENSNIKCVCVRGGSACVYVCVCRVGVWVWLLGHPDSGFHGVVDTRVTLLAKWPSENPNQPAAFQLQDWSVAYGASKYPRFSGGH
jgi:hypothetical protein